MKNTPEFKARFFTLYWSQNICQTKGGKYPINEDCFPLWDKAYIELKYLSEITDKDSINVAKLVYPTEENWSKTMQTATQGQSFIEDTFYSSEDNFSIFGINNPMDKINAVIDFLRYKGYAVPYMGLSLEEMAEYGWIKLS